MDLIKLEFKDHESEQYFYNTFFTKLTWTIRSMNKLISTIPGIVNPPEFSNDSDDEIYGWDACEIARDPAQFGFFRSLVGYYILLPQPKPIFKKPDSIVQASENVSKSMIGSIVNGLEGIDDGGERITYGQNGAMREPSTGKGRFDLISPFGLQRIARWYELGSLKYAERNWEKGIPFSRCMDSAMRHLNKYMMGMTDEDHLAAAAWNVIAMMHYEETGQNEELDDLPHYDAEEKKTSVFTYAHSEVSQNR